VVQEASARGGLRPSSIIRTVVTLVELWLMAMVLILGAAFIMSFFGANPDASFASWVYGRTHEIMRPFDGIFDPIQLTGGKEVQTSLLFAMVVYVVLASALNGVARRLD